MVTTFKDKMLDFIDKCKFGESDLYLEPAYKFIDDRDVFEPLVENLYKEVRLNLYNLSKEKSITYVNELINDLRSFKMMRSVLKKLFEDYDNCLLELPESGANNNYRRMVYNSDEGIETELKPERVKVNIYAGLVILCNEHREDFLESLSLICEDFKLPFKLFSDEMDSYQLEEINIEGFEDFNKDPKVETIVNKLQWKGTPGEFGAIYDVLIDKGFIEVVKNKKNIVRILHSLFDVKNEKGVEVTDTYLYRCFNDKKKIYPPHFLKIPFSDNYHNK